MLEITRRKFVATTAAALAGTTLKGAAQKQGAKRPNVLMIITDEQSRWTLGAYGAKLPGTPNIDSIEKEGAAFQNFFVTSAVCTPSRGCYSVLFNRKNDPLQLHNLYNDPAYQHVVDDLTWRTIEHNKEVGSPPKLMNWLTVLAT